MNSYWELRLVDQQDLLPESITLYPSKIKWIFMIVVSILFLVVGIADSGGDWINSLICVFGGLGILVSILTLWPNSSWLKLGPDGMRERVLFRKFYYHWSEVTHFGITVVRHRSGAHRSDTEFVSFWMKCDHDMRSLSECYGKKAEELMEILEPYRNRYG